MKLNALVAAVVALAWAAPDASAKTKGKREPMIKVTGLYKVKFESVVDTCRGTGVSIDRGKIKIARNKKPRRITVNAPFMPPMKGIVRRGGRFTAKARRGPSTIQGLLVRTSIRGRLAGGIIQLMIVADYFQGKRAYCTQSWKATGLPYKGKKKRGKK